MNGQMGTCNRLQRCLQYNYMYEGILMTEEHRQECATLIAENCLTSVLRPVNKWTPVTGCVKCYQHVDRRALT